MSPYPHVATDADLRAGTPRSGIPTAAEIEAADEQHDAARPPVIAVGTGFVALLFLVALVVWLVIASLRRA